MSTTLSVDTPQRPKPLTPATLRELSVRSDLRGGIRTLTHYGAIAAIGKLKCARIRWSAIGLAGSL